MDRQRLSELARKGGRAAHAAGTAHRFTSDEAREAGRRGGLASHARRRLERERQEAGERKEPAQGQQPVSLPKQP